MSRIKIARQEVEPEGHELVWGGVEFKLPAALPASLLESFGLAAQQDPSSLNSMLHGLLDGQWKMFLELQPSVPDVMEILTAVLPLYGIDGPGNSSASPASSKNGGARSRPTSAGTTKRR